MYISELLEKPILSLYEGEILGNIKKIYFDKARKKIKSFEIINDDDIAYCLLPKFIYTIGKHAITIKNKENITLTINEDVSSNFILPLNVKLYSLQGEYLGIVRDYSLNEKFILENIVLDNDTLINVDDIASCSNSSVVTYCSDAPKNIKTFRYRIQPKATSSTKVKVLPKLFSSFNKIAPSPSKEGNFIVGRICTKDIYDANHNLIIKQNSTITEQILALASSQNKLQDLMKYSKFK